MFSARDRKCRYLIGCLWFVAIACPGRSIAADAPSAPAPNETPQIAPWRAAFGGIDLADLRATSPRPMRGYAVRIELGHPGIEFLATPANGTEPGETDGTRTGTFLSQHGCQVAVNASPFAPIHAEEGKPQDVHGLMISQGSVVSEANGRPALLITKDNRASIAKPPFKLENVYNAVAGFSIVLADDQVVEDTDAVHPRTAAGTSADGRYLYLLVIDGRQPGYSEGATTAEVGAWLKRLGASEGINLDGGGTTTLIIDSGNGTPKPLNRPIHAGVPGQQRVAASHLGVRARPLGDVPQGHYFAKKQYRRTALPVFEEARSKLPQPIFDEDPAYVQCYWKAWELAFRNFHEPAAESGFVSQFIDAAFNQNIFLWDTCFLTMFCNYGHPHVPGIRSLDNFYAKQHGDGEICREINRQTGRDFEPWVNVEGAPLLSRWGYEWERGTQKTPVPYIGREPPPKPPRLTLDALNHPILAWAEMESYRLTGDRRRLRLVWPPLVEYYRALKEHLRQGNGLYMTDSASMDNSPRNRWLRGGGTAVDTSCEMVLFARNLAEMAELLDLPDDAARYGREADELARLIRAKMWNGQRRFFFDLTAEQKHVPVRTVAAYWTLVAGVADEPQVAALIAALKDPHAFGTRHRVPTLAADEEAFQGATGGYWRGAVWAPTTMMVVRGLQRCGRDALAHEIAVSHLESVVAVFRDTGTIWENYAPQQIAPGKPAKRDFVGWSGIAPIALLIEHALGVRADATTNTIVWTIRSPKRVGIERFWFAGRTVSLLCEPPDDSDARRVQISSDGPLHLVLRRAEKELSLDIAAHEPVTVRL
ncbi:MAG: phosphodiester glycosidase family protein [Pirellulales bacterium]|nr:phosphodiester glycosidase family protein [Pirellulales bacterium]